MPTSIKVLDRGALNVACPVCFAEAGHSCFTVIGRVGTCSRELKNPHAARTRAAKPPKIVSKTTQRTLPKRIPLETRIDDELDSLRDLRRSLCCYANSDSRCDCKYLTRQHEQPDSIEARGGERTGCCEVRGAIAKLELVKKSFELARQARGPQPAKP